MLNRLTILIGTVLLSAILAYAILYLPGDFSNPVVLAFGFALNLAGFIIGIVSFLNKNKD
jgi:hypothetical protein